MGERTPLALLSGPASGRMAVGEAITNIAAADVNKIGDIKLSANWMAAAGHPGEDAVLYDTVRAVGEQLCPALGIAIPVGKDSVSMKTRWAADGGRGTQEVVAPVSLIVSAFAVVDDVRRTLTPQLQSLPGDSSALFLLDLANGAARVGGSALAQAHQQTQGAPPDLDDPALVRAFFAAVRAASRAGVLAAYHDRSDGGLLTTVVEMAIAGRRTVHLDLAAAVARAPAGTSPLEVAFAEELGAVVQVARADVDKFREMLRAHGLPDAAVVEIGTVRDPAKGARAELVLQCGAGAAPLLRSYVGDLAKVWYETSYRMAALRDDPECAAEEFEGVYDEADPGLGAQLTFAFPRPDAGVPDANSVPRALAANPRRPRVAILREQGVNGQVEMAAGFVRAGFDAVDVHMTDLLAGRVDLRQFRGLAAVGGFSYGDVLGAGEGWAKSILFHAPTRQAFADFFARADTFAFGVCNGCQMLSTLKELIPGAEGWPRFVRNRSEQFEARFVPVAIPGAADGRPTTRSVILGPMAGSRLPISTAHGEGRAIFPDAPDQQAAAAALYAAGQVALQYVDNHGQPTQRYPFNPNGSVAAIAGVCSADGRVTIIMPHPERVHRWFINSYVPPAIRDAVTAAQAVHAVGSDDEQTALDEGPWAMLFHNARRWADSVPDLSTAAA